MKYKAYSLLVTFTLPSVINGFASWFVDQSSACFRDLAEGEVIMNNEIIAVKNSKYPNIRLKQVNEDSKEELEYESNGQEFKITLHVPYDKVYDLQYVLESDEGGEFVGTGSGCEGRRASARKKDDYVVLKLTGEEDSVKVWGGWATGHEAVTLIPPITFRKKGIVSSQHTDEMKRELTTKEEDEKSEKEANEEINDEKKEEEPLEIVAKKIEDEDEESDAKTEKLEMNEEKQAHKKGYHSHNSHIHPRRMKPKHDATNNGGEEKAKVPKYRQPPNTKFYEANNDNHHHKGKILHKANLHTYNPALVNGVIALIVLVLIIMFLAFHAKTNKKEKYRL